MLYGNQQVTHRTRLTGWLIRLVITGIGVVVLAACGDSNDTPIPAVDSVPTRTLVPPTSTPTLPPDNVTPTPTDLPAPATLAAASTPVDADRLIPASAQHLIEIVANDLLTNTTIDPAEVRVLSLERFAWSDAAWGCNARHVAGSTGGRIIPGYRIIFAVGARIYPYHTDRRETFFLCEDRYWLALTGDPLPLDPIALSIVEMSARDAATRLDVPEHDLELISLLAMTWPDSSVGCPKPGAEYEDKETVGYRIVFRVRDQTLTYHTSIRHSVYCPPAEEILPGFLRRALPTSTPEPPPTE